MAHLPRPGPVGACVLSMLLASPAWAEGPKILVLPYQHLSTKMPEDLGEQTTVVVTKEMTHGGLEVLRADDLGDATAPKPKASATQTPSGDPRAAAKAEQWIVEAKNLMEEAEFSAAIKRLKKAVRLLRTNADAVPDLRLLPEAYLQLGVAYFRDGMEDEGDEMLNKAVRLAPERKLSSADYPPIFLKVYDRARFNVLRRPRAQIEVKATPGAQVLYDGRNMGKAPILLKDALPGVHWLRVERPRRDPGGEEDQGPGQSVHGGGIFRGWSQSLCVSPPGGGDGGHREESAGIAPPQAAGRCGPSGRSKVCDVWRHLRHRHGVPHSYRLSSG